MQLTLRVCVRQSHVRFLIRRAGFVGGRFVVRVYMWELGHKEQPEHTVCHSHLPRPAFARLPFIQSFPHTTAHDRISTED